MKESWRKDLHIILLNNKIDLNINNFETEFSRKIKSVLIPNFAATILGISAKDNINIEILKLELSNYVESLKIG